MSELLQFIAILGLLLKGFTASGVNTIRTTNQTRFYRTGNEDTLGCPSWNEIPDKLNDQPVCAVNYNGIGGDYEVNACNGAAFLILDGETNNAGNGNSYPMGSILVKPGCSLYLFKGNLGGSSVALTDSLFNNLKYWWSSGSQGVYGPQSYICSCKKEPECSPSDAWETIMVCDNSENKVTNVDCNYLYSVGLGSNSNPVILEELEGMFSNNLGVSANTGFDWTKPSLLSKEYSKSEIVTAQVKRGHVMEIQQVVGFCGSNRIRTNYFRFAQFFKSSIKPPMVG